MFRAAATTTGKLLTFPHAMTEVTFRHGNLLQATAAFYDWMRDKRIGDLNLPMLAMVCGCSPANRAVLVYHTWWTRLLGQLIIHNIQTHTCLKLSVIM